MGDRATDTQCAAFCKHSLTQIESQEQYTFPYYKHIFTKRTHTHTHTHVYHPQRPLCCRADGAGVVSFNDGEASPGEASLSNILSGACADSAHQHDTDVGQGTGKRGTFKSQRWAEKTLKCSSSSLWLDESLATFKEQQPSHLKEMRIATPDCILRMYHRAQTRFPTKCAATLML